MIYYTSDLHIGHERIISICNRPFQGVEQMQDKLIENWNSVVGAKDEVYVLGDMFFKTCTTIEQALSKLKGKKHLIVGNHDKEWMKNVHLKDFFESVDDLKEIRDGGKQVVLCHYPIVNWNGDNTGAIHVHGHIHNDTSLPAFRMLRELNAFHAGVDTNDFLPRTLEQLKTSKERFYERVYSR